MTTRWGILGCGFISSQFASCLLPLENAEIVAVASQTPGRAEAFAKKFGNPTVYTSYQQLVEDDSIDIIYIGTPHSFHFDHASLALNNNKHVLCEKPISLNAKLAGKMFDLAKQKHLFLMEALWTRFLPAIVKLKEVVQGGKIGEVHTVQADFSIIRPFNPKHRLYNPELGGGALLDLGIYPLTFAQLIFDDFPQSVQTRAVLGRTGVDETSSYLLEFEGGKTAVLSASVRSASPHQGIIIGSKGYITVPDFYHPREFTIHYIDDPGQSWDDRQQRRFEAPYDVYGYGPEAMEVMRCLNEGMIESPLMPWSLSLKMMDLMDSIRSQWGMTYPSE